MKITLILSLVALSVFAADSKAKWTEWLAQKEKLLKDPYSFAATVDIVKIKPGATADVPKIGKVFWNGKTELKFELQGGGSKQMSLLPGADPKQEYRLEKAALTDLINVDGTKWKKSEELAVYFYNPKREGIEKLQKFPTFSYNPSFKVEARFQAADHPKEMLIPASRGAPKPFKKIGQLAFALEGKPQTLSVMVADPSEKYIFLMFRDATNEIQTYGAGRYLEIDIDKAVGELKTGEKVTIDFNFAFSPLCARSKAYFCPYAQDRLNIAVLAGEKALPK
ncbi:DUF1684 domain-containing protein [bacterium]|nr:DUF1684 domain-containing protein [bacterium]